MQLPREVNKRYSDFTPLNPGAMFCARTQGRCLPSPPTTSRSEGTSMLIRTKKLFLAAMRTRDSDAQSASLGLVLAGLQLLLSFWPDNFNDKSYGCKIAA